MSTKFLTQLAFFSYPLDTKGETGCPLSFGTASFLSTVIPAVDVLFLLIFFVTIPAQTLVSTFIFFLFTHIITTVHVHCSIKHSLSISLQMSY